MSLELQPGRKNLPLAQPSSESDDSDLSGQNPSAAARRSQQGVIELCTPTHPEPVSQHSQMRRGNRPLGAFGEAGELALGRPEKRRSKVGVQC